MSSKNKLVLLLGSSLQNLISDAQVTKNDRLGGRVESVSKALSNSPSKLRLELNQFKV